MTISSQAWQSDLHPVSSLEGGRCAGRILLLDGLRGIAAVAVMFHHEQHFYREVSWFSRGYLAVDFFFLLSGFVLTLAFDDRLARNLSARRFMTKRIARLWPMVSIGIFLGTIEFTLINRDDLSCLNLIVLISQSLLMIPILQGIGPIFILNSPQWSLLCELVANFVHAIVFSRLRDRILLAASIIFGLWLCFLSIKFDKIGLGGLTTDWWAGFVRVGFSYSLGIWLGRKWRQDRRTKLVPWWVAFGALPVALLLIRFVPISTGVGDGVVVLLIFPLIVWAASNAPAPEPIKTAMIKLGNMSYPLYAIHRPIQGIGVWLSEHSAREDGSAIRFGATCVAVALASALGERLFSRVWQRLREGLPRTRQAQSLNSDFSKRPSTVRLRHGSINVRRAANRIP